MRKKNRNIIEGQGITYNYLHYDEDGKVDSAQLALDHVDLDVEAGQFIAILGHNGSGKSTLAKQINALLLPGEGTLYVDGNDTRDDYAHRRCFRRQEVRRAYTEMYSIL